MTEPYTPTPEEVRQQVQDGSRSSGGIDGPMFDRMLDAVRAEAWDEGRRGAITDHQPPLSGFAHRVNPYRKLDAAEGSEPSDKNGGERAGRVGRERIDIAPVTPPAEEWTDPEPWVKGGLRRVRPPRRGYGYEHGWREEPRTREEYETEESGRG